MIIMKYEIETRISYMIFSEDTTYLNNKDSSNFLIYSPKFNVQTDYPFTFSTHLSIGLISPKEELEKLTIIITNENNDILETIEVGKIILDRTAIPDNHVFSGNFTMESEDELVIEQPGSLKANVLFDNDTVLGETYVLFREMGEKNE
ncbi:hypothetical protein BK131_03570 [Paenibacillus amylolyticus]|uniref:Uncharacterized protein n=1 Tax=Paenibacillus amylolyticus TaxID=1451 RepID=A0A1R1C4L7_PAEAM|nr:hypothetical protein BK131_03570 [Paenibacillus amylolyticus]